jgi:hypothetical protein
MNDTTFQGDGKVAYVPVVVNAKPKPITNAMKIRAMTDEELADWLFQAWHNSWYTLQEWLDWLKEEATEDDNNS